MRAGLFRHLISIERLTDGVDAFGGQSQTWAAFVSTRAEVLQATTGEFIREYGPTSESTVVFRVWFDERITTGDRVSFNGVAHDIVEIKEIGRRKGLEIRTVRRA